MYVLPDSLREQLREPLGELVDEPRLLQLLTDETYIVSVGDQVTATLLRHNITPVLCIVDFIIKRSAYEKDLAKQIKNFPGKHINVTSPPKVLSDELWDAIAAVYGRLDQGPFCIEVTGEEDLAALAAIYLAPSDVTVIYGMPDKGVVVVKATEAHKQKVKQILDKM